MTGQGRAEATPEVTATGDSYGHDRLRNQDDLLITYFLYLCHMVSVQLL